MQEAKETKSTVVRESAFKQGNRNLFKRKIKRKSIIVAVVVLCIIAVGGGISIKVVTDHKNYNNAKDCIMAQDVTVEYTGEGTRISANDFISETDETDIIYTARFADSDADEYTLAKDLTVGQYNVKVIIELTKNMFFRELIFDAKIILQDTTPPKWIKTTDSVTVYVGESIDIQSLFAAKDLSGDVTISAEDEINTDSAGTETVKITASDPYGNASEYELKITVKKKENENTSDSNTFSKSNTAKDSTKSKINSSSSNNKRTISSSSNKTSSSATSSSNSTTTAPYWCTDGGSHHVVDYSGMEETEGSFWVFVGWYNSYNEARDAAFAYLSSHLEYTHYIVQDCDCGLFGAYVRKLSN